MDFRPINVLISSALSQRFGETSIDLNSPDMAFCAVRLSDRVMSFNRAETRWETPTHRPLDEDFGHEANNVGDPTAFAEGFKVGVEITNMVAIDPLGPASIGGVLKRAQSAHIQNLTKHRETLIKQRDAKNVTPPAKATTEAAPQAEAESVVRDRGGAFDALASYWLRRIEGVDGNDPCVPEFNLEDGADTALVCCLDRRGITQRASEPIAYGLQLGLHIARLLQSSPFDSERAIRKALDDFLEMLPETFSVNRNETKQNGDVAETDS